MTATLSAPASSTRAALNGHGPTIYLRQQLLFGRREPPMDSPATPATPLAASRSTTGAALADATRLGAGHLTATDLDRRVAFSEQSIGLRLHRRADGVAALGTGAEDVVVLHESRDARRA